MPDLRDEPNSFEHRGEYWIVTFRGNQIFLRDTASVRYLVQIIRHRELHVFDVVGVSYYDHGIPAADEQTKRDYKRAIDELRTEIEDADDANDPARAERARDELGRLLDEVASRYGLGDEPRIEKATVNRVRDAVARGVRRLIERIRREDRLFAEHLEASIRFGTVCRYAPDPIAQIVWQISGPTT